MKILWIKTELLHPVDKGGKIRTYEMLKRLKREHHITYLTLDDGGASPEARTLAAEYCHELVCIPHTVQPKFSPAFYSELALNVMSPLPYAVGKYASREMQRSISERAKAETPDVVVCDFLAPSVNLPRNIGCATVLFQHNVEAIIWKRHSEAQQNPVKRAYLKHQWRKMRAHEKSECLRFDQVIAVSREDQQIIEREYGVSGVASVPTGVDTTYFKPSPGMIPRPNTLVFTGSMDWLPNVDAVHYFADEVLPIVKAQIPGISLTIVGRSPDPSVIKLGKRVEGITVTGGVPDIRPHVERATAYVVPIRIGGGTRLKIFEAMAMRKAIVSTSIGAEGLPLTDGKELLIRDTSASFAGAIVSVLSNSSLSYELGTNALRAVTERFSWEQVAARFTEICDRVKAEHDLNKRFNITVPAAA